MIFARNVSGQVIRPRRGRGCFRHLWVAVLLLLILCEPSTPFALGRRRGRPKIRPDDCSREPFAPDANPQYFPKGVFGPDSDYSAYIASINACFLRAMGDTSLSGTEQSRSEVYRLLVVPAWRPPFVVRLEMGNDGAGTLVVKEALSQKYSASLVLNRTKKLTKAEVSGFLELLQRARFWSMPTTPWAETYPRIEMTMDGIVWLLEGADGKRYHVVTRTSPKPGPYASLTSYLFRDLAGLTIPPGPTIPHAH